MKTDHIKISPEWSKSKEEIWAAVFEGTDTSGAVKMVPRKRRGWFYAAASIAAIAVILPSIAFFHTRSEVAKRGCQLAVVLPDGSRVDLNAGSRISYKPLWWGIAREVELQGEACFEVEKRGSSFDVQCDQYTVSVVGTSFNVFSRAGKFNVTCLSGKVKVSDKSESVMLTANRQAVWRDGKLMVDALDSARKSIGWKQGRFVFVGVPLREAIQEIERQYDIEVLPDLIPDYFYSGNFTKANDPNKILKIIGTPFGIEFKIK